MQFDRKKFAITSLSILALVLAIASLTATARVQPKFETVAAKVVEGNTIVLVGDLVPNGGLLGPGSLANVRTVRDLTLTQHPAAIFHLGDLQYECGSPSEFKLYYDAVYGALKDKIVPSIGNHEYCGGSRPNAEGFFGYFGPHRTYFSVDVRLPSGPHVHIVVLNSNCQQWNTVFPGCGTTQAMRTWLRSDLAADTAHCTIAVWHEPAFGSQIPGHPNGGKVAMRGPWATLETRGVDGVVSAHAHNYQRYARLDHTGAQTASGMPSTIVGTGGRSIHDVTAYSYHAALRALNDTSFGILVMKFNATGTGWIQSFKTTTGKTLDTVAYGCT